MIEIVKFMCIRSNGLKCICRSFCVFPLFFCLSVSLIAFSAQSIAETDSSGQARDTSIYSHSPQSIAETDSSGQARRNLPYGHIDSAECEEFRVNKKISVECPKLGRKPNPKLKQEFEIPKHQVFLYLMQVHFNQVKPIFYDESAEDIGRKERKSAKLKFYDKPSEGVIENPSEDSLGDFDWREYLSNTGRDMSFDEKISFIQGIGVFLYGNYDSSQSGRLGEDDNYQLDLEGLLSGRVGGICGDIAQTQALVLNELGVDPENMLIVSFPRYGNHHMALVVSDPHSPEQYYFIDNAWLFTWSTNQTAHFEGIPQVLTTLDVTLYDQNLVPVSVQKTALGKALEEVFEMESGSKKHSFERSFHIKKEIMSSENGDMTVSPYHITFDGGRKAQGLFFSTNVNKKHVSVKYAFSFIEVDHAKNYQILGSKFEADEKGLAQYINLETHSDTSKSLYIYAGLMAGILNLWKQHSLGGLEDPYSSENHIRSFYMVHYIGAEGSTSPDDNQFQYGIRGKNSSCD